MSFEGEVPSVSAFAGRIEKALERWAWLVAEIDGRPCGYAYGGEHRTRTAYRYSTEISVYLDPRVHRRGIGRRLYERLFARLVERGYCNAYAGITLPNDASVRLHESMGMRSIGVFPRVGWKFGTWHDVGWWHVALREVPRTDEMPTMPAEGER